MQSSRGPRVRPGAYLLSKKKYKGGKKEKRRIEEMARGGFKTMAVPRRLHPSLAKLQVYPLPIYSECIHHGDLESMANLWRLEIMAKVWLVHWRLQPGAVSTIRLDRGNYVHLWLNG